jgi:hypothetical protein
MPAKSQKQHGIMGMALAYKRGKLKPKDIPERIRKKVKQIAASMSDDQLSHFTATKAKQLPKRIGKGAQRRIRKTRSS